MSSLTLRSFPRPHVQTSISKDRRRGRGQRSERPAFLLPQDSVLVEVQPDGLCFWSSLYCAVAADGSKLLGWYNSPRNAKGWLAPEASKRESDAVRAWALSLDSPEGAMPAECRKGIVKGQCAVSADIAFWLDFRILHVPLLMSFVERALARSACPQHHPEPGVGG